VPQAIVPAEQPEGVDEDAEVLPRLERRHAQHVRAAEIADACSRPPLEVPVARELAGFIWGMMTDRLAVS